MNIAEIVEGIARRQPGRTALIDPSRELSFGELASLIRRTASVLRRKGVAAGARVGVCLGDDADYLVALLAAAAVGAISVPLDWRSTAKEREAAVGAFGLSFILGVPGPIGGAIALPLDEAWRREVAAADPIEGFAAGEGMPWLVCLSSGTTGAPKGAMLTHEQQHARYVARREGVGWGEGERHLSATALCFVAARDFCLDHLLTGNTVILFPTLFGPEELVAGLKRYRATMTQTVPTILRRLLKLPHGEEVLLPGLKHLLVTGAVLHADEKRAALRRVSGGLCELYGSAAGGPIAFLRAEEIDGAAESVGRPTTHAEVQIVDEHDRVQPPGAIGRLRCRGPAVASAFLGAGLGASDELFRDGWCYTGEVAMLDARGFLHLKGRVSDLILRGGANVYPSEVEAVLQSHPDVIEAAVVGWPDPGLGEEVAAFVIARRPIAAQALVRHCRGRLTPYKIPREVFQVEEMPRTASGKVQKGALAARLPRR